ncbi:hypothetical protein GLIP_0869 [Aliiglaciecola lipolytica E3]|uniref:Transposase n=1 Tax=Aliiglaciecola lipolytica E3 TaxID=1127673 RepID=K6Y5J5_9ALTE|nr:hypothetical protein GLIP_0869 [Aliiglaciecola lipolytica E3]
MSIFNILLNKIKVFSKTTHNKIETGNFLTRGQYHFSVNIVNY